MLPLSLLFYFLFLASNGRLDMISLMGFPCIFYLGLGSSFEKDVTGSGGPAPGLTGISVDKSVEFSYEELATATDNFSMANKIGQGGFGAVYYAELRGEVCSHMYFYSS
jgi:hypothetical protein